MTLEITPSGQACGAEIRGVDLSAPLPAEIVAGIRAAWLEHQVLSFPDQSMSDADLERFTLYFGPFGEDPFIASIPGHQHIIAVQRAADETAPIFAESWHTDWSFQAAPPSGTCLFGITIPPRGGDTLFANQYLALEQMPTELRERLDGKKAIHSAKNAYAPDGMYGEADKASGRSMTIIASTEAQASQIHDIIREHPETGRESVFGTAGYITGFEGMAPDEGWELLAELYRWQTRPEFQYRHVWQENMLVMWDNRCLLHMATGGYPGHARLLHRTTIGAA
ncbi:MULTISPECIES: TauD/TfdA dioxygenase family protein [unclassified Hyphomonas]|jgi:taurine dioxygenase|uniref:Probable dioxygenase n=3 Tax=root TaxID=1 RepID=A0A160TYA2_9ZZZZ|nr:MULTISPECIES: TauD/TfdA family dioxygenase [unclassified Hyphomonas]MAA81067.1 taurine dioxygenase [Hyphomonas sp.]|tara:strand:- start:11557 stop:12399 length:843 start_codon:yes stop_codon:yes gene_type:complete